MSAFLLKVVVPLVLGAVVAALVIVLTAPRPEVPCADPFGPGGTVTHLWCQAPAGVTP